MQHSTVIQSRRVHIIKVTWSKSRAAGRRLSTAETKTTDIGLIIKITEIIKSTTRVDEVWTTRVEEGDGGRGGVGGGVITTHFHGIVAVERG